MALVDIEPDPELDAIAACLRALLPLDRPARSRVLEYLDDRLDRDCYPPATEDDDG